MSKSLAAWAATAAAACWAALWAVQLARRLWALTLPSLARPPLTRDLAITRVRDRKRSARAATDSAIKSATGRGGAT